MQNCRDEESYITLTTLCIKISWRTEGQSQNKNQREGNTPPSPIAILLVLRKPKN
jgi:hypothetical protein